MSALDCGAVREAAPEFALGVLDGEARADVLLHLDHCSVCRTVVSELSDAGDAIVLLAPEAAPPPDFERRVLGAMAGSERRRRWRTAKLVAAVAAAAMILSIATVRIVDNQRSSTTAVAAAPQTVAMVGASDQRVGEVAVTQTGVATSIAISVDGYAVPDGSYRVVLDPAGGTSQSLGTIDVQAGQGAWKGTSPAATGGATVALVDTAGRRLCTAQLPTM